MSRTCCKGHPYVPSRQGAAPGICILGAAMPVLLPACMHACLLPMLTQGLGALYNLCADFRQAGGNHARADLYTE